MDGSDSVLYYGRLKRIATSVDESGTQAVAILAGLSAGTYTLKVFTEQYNGDYKTDYASAFADVTLTVSVAPAADIPKTGDGSMPLLWAGLAVLSGAGLVALRKRRRA